jgi:hypothetical protein
MPKSAITIACMNPWLKNALMNALEEMAETEADFDSSAYLQSLEDIPDCTGKKPIEFAEEAKPAAAAATATERASKPKRAPSAYQKHTGECMRAGNSMKECAAKWRAKKGK